MRKLLNGIEMITICVLFVGCGNRISQEEYSSVVTERDELREQVFELESKLHDSITSEMDALEQVIQLEEELKKQKYKTGELQKIVPVSNLIAYDLENSMTIPLAQTPGERDHYAVASIILIIDSKHEDYKIYGTEEKLKEDSRSIKNTIRKVFAEYTVDQAKDPAYENVICQAILDALHTLYYSDFIYDVRFSELLIQ